jgi:hypothetical protein
MLKEISQENALNLVGYASCGPFVLSRLHNRVVILLQVFDPSVCFGVAASDCLHYMMRGSSLIKVRPNSRQYHRFFTLSEDLTAIKWTPTSKKASKAVGAYSKNITNFQTKFLHYFSEIN